MQKSSIEKWVDELQAQIDQVKREVQGIPAPVGNGITIISGEVEMTASTADGTVSGVISGTFDDVDNDYFLSLQYYTAVHDDVEDSDTVVFGTIANVKTDGTMKSALFTAAKVVYPLSGTTTIDSGIGRLSHTTGGTGIALEVGEIPEILDGTYDMEYVIIAVPKATDNTRTKKKSTKKK